MVPKMCSIEALNWRCMLTNLSIYNRLRWFGYVQMKTFDAPVRRVESIIVDDKRSQGRPKRTWNEQIRVDL